MRSRPLHIALFGLALLLVASSGCDRNTEPYVPGEQARQPDLSRIFPDQGAGPQLPDAPVAPAAAAGSAPSGGAPIVGRVEIAPYLVAGAPSGGVLFVIARRAGAAGGPPVAALRIPQPQFPVAFEIGQQQVMIPGVQFAGELELTVRLDADGNVMTKSAGDLAGRHRESLAPGAEGVSIVLDERLTGG